VKEKVYCLAAGHEIRGDSWHCTEAQAPRLADIIQPMSQQQQQQQHESGLGIHYNVGPGLEEELDTT